MKKRNIASNLLTVALAVGIVFQQSIAVRAAHGDPDVSFGVNGVKTDILHDRSMQAASIAQQADGRLLVAGKMTLAGTGYDLLLLRRYNTNGSVDTGFGSSGFGVEIINGQPSYIYGAANITESQNSLVVQTDGKIVVASNSNIFRFLPSGELDTSFGNQGRVNFASGGVLGLELFKGRLLTRVGSALVRLSSDGSIDTAFGSAGWADIGISAYTFTVNRKTGKLIVGGMASVPNDPNNSTVQALQHFNMNGTPDTSHGIDGIVALDLNGPCSHQLHAVTGLDTQADGKVLAAGFRGGYPVLSSNFFVRLLADDTLDTSFGSGGFAVGCDGSDPRPRIRASRTTTQILARVQGVDDISNELKRYSSGGLSQLAFPSATDFLTQTNDEKIVTVKTGFHSQYYIQLRRFIP